MIQPNIPPNWDALKRSDCDFGDASSESSEFLQVLRLSNSAENIYESVPSTHRSTDVDNNNMSVSVMVRQRSVPPEQRRHSVSRGRKQETSKKDTKQRHVSVGERNAKPSTSSRSVKQVPAKLETTFGIEPANVHQLQCSTSNQRKQCHRVQKKHVTIDTDRNTFSDIPLQHDNDECSTCSSDSDSDSDGGYAEFLNGFHAVTERKQQELKGELKGGVPSHLRQNARTNTYTINVRKARKQGQTKSQNCIVS
jgi:hypothetical protein